jgi:putative transposase
MKRQWIEPENEAVSIAAQCELLGLSRSSYYYIPVPISSEDQLLMGKIDEIYTESPSYGARRISQALKRKGYYIGRRHTATLMVLMGISAILPTKSLSKRHPEHKIYPYLLRDVNIARPNQVWSTDITYIRLRQGFVYLTVIMDWYSRYVISWRLSNTLDGSFCREALREALTAGKPEIFNSDQGSQFTDEDFTSILSDRDIQISMDGKGRALDNVFVERLWRTVKYEEVYLKSYENMRDCYESLKAFFHKYNYERPHQSLEYKTPWEIYNGIERLKRIA